MFRRIKINLFQRPLKTALTLIFLIIAIGFVGFASLTNASSQKLRYDTYENIGNFVTVDMRELKGDNTIADVKERILALDGVLGTYEANGAQIRPINFELVKLYTGENPYEQKMSDEDRAYYEKFGERLSITGWENLMLSDDFRRGFSKLVEGEYPTEENGGVIVSREFSELNNMTIGDKLEFGVYDVQMNVESSTYKEKGVYEAPIVGIYETSLTFEVTENNIEGEYLFRSSPYNKIWTSFEYSVELQKLLAETAFFFFGTESPEAAVRVKEEIINMNVIGGRVADKLWIKWENYNDLSPALDSFQMSIFYIFISTMSVGGLLILILRFMISDKKEVGVLLCMGERRKNIIKEKFFEYLILILISLPIALVSAYFGFLAMLPTLNPNYVPMGVGYVAMTGRETLMADLTAVMDFSVILHILSFAVLTLLIWTGITFLQIKNHNTKKFIMGEEE